MNNELHIATLKNCNFKVKPSDHSAFAEIQTQSDLPCIHLVLVDETENMKWHQLSTCGIRNGQLVDVCDDAMEQIIKHYFGDTYSRADFAWRHAINSLDAVSLDTVHLHLYLAHVDLWGQDGLIRRCVASLLK